MKYFLLFGVIFVNNVYCFYYVEPGPKYPPTIGHPWPIPKNWTQSNDFFTIDVGNFNFRIADNNCDIIEKAVARYKRIIFPKHAGRSGLTMRTSDISIDPNFMDSISELVINLSERCETKPHMNMDESYQLTIDKNSLLESKSVWGILRGLETFAQLIVHTDGVYRVNTTNIKDEPRFTHRGLLVDTSRHYIKPSILYKILLGMSYNKLNVFHWHIVDDQSFPYESIKYPELSQKGAYNKDLVYSQDVIKDLKEFARLLGIRVMVEIDTPGHTRSWGVSHIELLTKCYAELTGFYGPLDPTKNFTYEFVNNVLEEARNVFPDDFIHLGADEVDSKCWSTNPEINKYMKEKNYTSYNQLQSEYISKILKHVNQLNVSSVVWQEAFQSDLELRDDTVVHVWKDQSPKAVLKNATEKGYRALLSAGWYLDHLQFSSDFPSFYSNEPTDFVGSPKQKELVIGGEACMWSEMVDNDSILTRIFLRVAAAAERLWSHNFDLTYAYHRIEEHSCRLKRRGIPTQPPNGPGFCIV